jgi:hypothetical protein
VRDRPGRIRRRISAQHRPCFLAQRYKNVMTVFRWMRECNRLTFVVLGLAKLAHAEIVSRVV